jgi:hypothetical protein
VSKRARAKDDEQLVEDKARWQTEGVVYADDVRGYINLGSDYIGDRVGERWKLRPEEKAKLALCTGVVIAKHSPAWLVHYAEEFSLIGAVLGIVGTRLLAMYIESRDKAEAEAAKPVEVDTAPAPNTPAVMVT